jgi:hypothetical protein
MQVESRYVAAAVKRAYPRSLTQIMRLMAPKMWITVTTIAKDQSVITTMATMYTFFGFEKYGSTRAVELCSAPGRAHSVP